MVSSNIKRNINQGNMKFIFVTKGSVWVSENESTTLVMLKTFYVH